MNIKYKSKDYINFFSNTIFGISFSNWIRLLAKNRFKIDIRFLPKVLFISFNSLINAPLQILEQLRYKKKIQNARVIKPIFILGHYRSGTTFLHNVLSKDPALAFCSTYEALIPNQFLTTGRAARSILNKLMPATRPQDNVKSGADMPIEEEFAMGNFCMASFAHGYYFPRGLYKVFDETVTFETASHDHKLYWQIHFNTFLKKLSFRNKGKRLVLKSPSNTGRMKELLTLYPDACFIHIHRDPYVVYQSNVNLYEKILPILSFQRAKNEQIAEFIFYSYRKIYEKFLRDKADVPNNRLFEMSYDDFVTDPVGQLAKVYDHLNIGDFEAALPFFDEEMKSVTEYKTNAYSKLGPDLKKRIEEEWALMFDHYGYPKQ